MKNSNLDKRLKMEEDIVDSIDALKENVRKYPELSEDYRLIAESTVDIIFQTIKTGKIIFISPDNLKISYLMFFQIFQRCQN